MLHSFDIFDTLITRRTYSPQGIFILMQHRLSTEPAYAEMDEYVRRNFAVLRSNAETLARKEYVRGLMEEITLPQIYDALALTGHLTPKEASSLMDLERETELNNVVGIQENIEKVRQLIQQKERVICISDMYLDSATIRAMLVKADPIFQDIPVYVSSEIKLLKGGWPVSGDLFRYAREKEMGSFSEWVHIGDNEYTDNVSADRLGIRSIKYEPIRLRPYENQIAEAFPHSPAAALAIGTARALRMNGRLDEPAALAGSSFAGPVLFSYVYWLLSDSMRRGIRRLYFVARDGYIPRKIADIIIEYLRLPLKTHYIYGSRRAWRMPSYMGDQEGLSEILALSSHDEVFTVKQFASVLQITEEELFAFFPEFQQIPCVSILTYAQMKKRVIGSEKFCAYLYQRNHEKRSILREYLLQEIDASDDHFAFVEMNGSGYSQLALTRLMKDMWKKPVLTYFFKMDKLYKDESCVFSCFFPRCFFQQDMLLEVMTRAPEEQTVSYHRVDGRIIPVRFGTEGKLIEDYHYQAYEEGVLAFCRCFIQAIAENGVQLELPLVDSYMKTLLNWTRCREFLYLADMPFCNNGREGDSNRFAPQLTDQQIEDIYLWNPGANSRKWYTGTSLDISLLRCTEAQKERLAQYRTGRKELFASIGTEDPYLTYPGHEDVPFALLGKRFVIYGAGKYGRKLYQEALKNGAVVVQWLDGNYSELKTGGIPVTGTIEDVGQVPYDCVVVAILNLYLAEEAKKQLVSHGIPEEKIYCPVSEAMSI